MLCRAARTQAARIEDAGGVLVVADADDDCSIQLAATLRRVAAPVQVEVAVAVREFESWFLASVLSLRSHKAVGMAASFDGDPEQVRGAKEALSRQMTVPYRETLHQPAFTQLMNLEDCRGLRSFDHLVCCVGRLIGAL